MSMGEAGVDPIGWVTWGDSPVVATLVGRDAWRVTLGGEDRPDIAATLAERYSDAYAGPSDGAYGHRILRELARKVDGEMTWNLPPREPDDASD